MKNKVLNNNNNQFITFGSPSNHVISIQGTPDKKVSWEFDEWELVGDGLAVWQVFEGRQANRLKRQLAKVKK